MKAACPDYAQVGHQNMHKFGRTDKGVQRYQCKTCKQTYAKTKGTVFHGCHHSQETILECLTMLADRTSKELLTAVVLPAPINTK